MIPILRLVFLGCFFLINSFAFGQETTIWKIGESDDRGSDMALSEKDYKRFLEYDFGYEDRLFLIGKSDIQKEWPYVLPGPRNGWGGTATLSGIRSHFLTAGFELEKGASSKGWVLSIDFLGIDSQYAPSVKVIVNGKPWTFKLKKGTTKKEPIGPFNKDDEQLLSLDLPENLIVEGYNEVLITSIDGGWVAFDQIMLTGPSGAKLRIGRDVLIKTVQPASLEIFRGKRVVQPLLIDVANVDGQSTISVELDGKEIIKQVLDSGRTIVEAPMPSIKKKKSSKYRVLVNGKERKKGVVLRGPQRKGGPASYVNTMIGVAHSRWMIAPGPWMPFSMVKLSPDNQNGGWQAGYEPTIESIGTFSHIHEWTMAGLGTFPVRGKLITEIGDQSSEKGGYRSKINKKTEEAPLGYYKVDLLDYGITAELTSLTRSSFQRYTYHEGDTGRVMIDLKIPAEYAYSLEEVEIRKVGDNRIEGFSKQISKNTWSGNIDQDYIVHFVIEFDQPIINYGTWLNSDIPIKQNLKAVNPNKAGMFVEFDLKKSNAVQLRTGISYVSVENAALNLKTEISDPFAWSFEAVRNKNESTWNELLSRVEITSDDYHQKERFYTNMYRSLASRNTFSDVDGSWRSADELVKKFTNSNDVALGCDAFWNTFWNLNQFWNLVTPEWSSRWVRSQLAMYDSNGWLAKGPAGMEYIPVMVAEHEIPLIVGAYQMGIRDYDVEKAFEAVHKMQTTLPTAVAGGFAGNRDLATYLEHHYVPYNKGRFSNSLEYSFDDWTVGQFAKALGKTSEYKIFNDRGSWWRNVIDTETGFARMRDSEGKWADNFDPFKSGANHHYVEGNAWQLTFFVPQDVRGLAALIGENNFIDRLSWGFEESNKWRYNGPNEQYWDYPVVQGNQQSMHFAYLFNWVKKPWLTQKWSRSIAERYYGHGVSNAYLGDEDQGQMSAWFVMNALGLFQTDGGTRVNPIYEIGSPLFEKVKINLGEVYGRGKEFVIEARNTNKKNVYVQSAILNGKPLNTFWFNSSELLKGGTLVLEMGDKPNKKWGIGEMPVPN